MLRLRRLHLYLGVFFAPMLIFLHRHRWYQTAYPIVANQSLKPVR